MFRQAAQLCSSGWRHVKQFAHQTVHVVSQIPATVRIIFKHKALKTVFKNALSLNLVKYLAPITALSLLKRYLFQTVAIEAGLSQEVANLAETAVDYTIITIVLVRQRSKLMALHMFSMATAASEINATFPQKPHTLCASCNTRSRLMDEIASQAHMVVGGLTMWGAGLMLSQLIGPWAKFLLKSYWDGYIYYQYTVSSADICGHHQLYVLTHQRQACMSTGIVFNLISQTPAAILSYYQISLGTPAQLAWDNILFLFGILHARTIAFPIPPQIEMNYLTFDPIKLSFLSTRYTTHTLIKYIQWLIRQRAEAPRKIALDFLKPVITLFQSQTKNPLVEMAMKIYFPPELRSLRIFIQHPTVRPYAGQWIAKLEYILETAQNISRLHAFRMARYLLRTSLMGRQMSALGKWGLTTFRGWPLDLVELLILMCKIPHLSQHIEGLLIRLKNIEPAPTTNIYTFWNPLARAKLMDSYMAPPSHQPSTSLELTPPVIEDYIPAVLRSSQTSTHSQREVLAGADVEVTDDYFVGHVR